MMGNIDYGNVDQLGVKIALRRAVTLLANRIMPSSFFTILLWAKGSWVVTQLAQVGDAPAPRRWQLYAEVANTSLSCLLLLIVAGLFLVRLRSVSKDTDLWARLVALGATFIMFMTALVPAPQATPVALLLSTVLIIAGSAIAVAGLITLRQHFGILPEARGLVTGGIYHYVRHPIYFGESLICIGIVSQALAPINLGILLAYLLLQWRRALNEEALMVVTFTHYGTYRERTRQFLPFLW